MIEALTLWPWLLAVPLAAAAAWAPWAALLGLAVVPHLPWAVPLPGGLPAFASPALALPAGFLLVADLLVRGRGPAWALWEVVHTPVRLLLPPLLVLLAADLAAEPPVAGAATLAGGIAIYLLFIRWGLAIRCEALGTVAPHRRFAGAAGGAALSIVLAAGAVWAPVWHAAAAAVLLAAPAIPWRPVLRSAAIAPRLAQDLSSVFAGGGGWREPGDLPRWLRRLSPLRATPALLHGERPGQGTRAGWFVVREEGPAFVFRSPTRVWSVPLDDTRPRWSSGLPAERGILVQRVVLVHGDDEIVLATSRGGPTRAELGEAFTEGTPVQHL